MTQINLLPPEIRQKRAVEHRRIAVGALLFVVIAALLGVWAFLMVLVSGERDTLGDLEAQNAQTRQAITEYQVFEKQRAEVQQKKQVVDQAIAGEIPWFKVLNEVSLVIPSEVWLVSFDGSEGEITFNSSALDSASDTPDSGHKPVAKWMVRLSEIPMLSEIWLTASTKSDGLVQFETSAKVKPPASPPAVPAPPSASTTPTGGSS